MTPGPAWAARSCSTNVWDASGHARSPSVHGKPGLPSPLGLSGDPQVTPGNRLRWTKWMAHVEVMFHCAGWGEGGWESGVGGGQRCRSAGPEGPDAAPAGDTTARMAPHRPRVVQAGRLGDAGDGEGWVGRAEEVPRHDLARHRRRRAVLAGAPAGGRVGAVGACAAGAGEGTGRGRRGGRASGRAKADGPDPPDEHLAANPPSPASTTNRRGCLGPRTCGTC
jgi:hypothetical protein